MSELTGTMVLLGVTVVVVGAFAAQLGAQVERGGPSDPHVDVMAEALVDTDQILLVHAGGPTLNADGLRVLVTVNGTVAHDGAPGTGPWGLGDTLHANLTEPIGPGSRIEVTVVWKPEGMTLLATTLNLPDGSSGSSSSATGASMEVELRIDGVTSGASKPVGSTMKLEADVDHTKGRLWIERVEVNLSALGGPSDFRLEDTGTNGDTVAGDGVYGGLYEIPVEAPTGNHTLTATATDLGGLVAEDTSVLEVTPVHPYYDTDVFIHVAHKVESNPLAGNHDELGAHIKFELNNSQLVLDGTTYVFYSATFVFVPFHDSDNGQITTTTDTVKACANTNDKLWSVPLPARKVRLYDSTASDVDYYFELTFKHTSTGTTDYVTYLVEASPTERHFTLPAGVHTKTVLDNGWPADGNVESC